MAKTYVEYNQASRQALSHAVPTGLHENISLENALGRVIASEIVCVKNLPSFNNSAMDGFAIKARDAGKALKVRKIIYAGDTCEPCLKEQECYKIMTGAQVPDDVDTIIPIEDVLSYENEEVCISEKVTKGNALRFKGEELAQGDRLFSVGTEITPAVIAVLASQGIVNIEVYKKLSIAVVSTGNELKEPWEKADEDEVYNCNSYAIIAVLKEKGFDASYLKVIPDSLEETVEFIKSLKRYDIIITSGGISMGDADFVGQAFEQNGLNTLFDGVNIKPGRPIMMGTMHTTFVVCLPGNPLTAMVNLYLFVLPILRRKQGLRNYYHNVQHAQNVDVFKTKTGRTNLVLGTLEEGKFTVTRGNKYGSGMITVLQESNAMFLSSAQTGSKDTGASVKVILLGGDYSDYERDILN